MLPDWLTPQAIELLWRGLVLTLIVTAVTTAGSLLLGRRVQRDGQVLYLGLRPVSAQ